MARPVIACKCTPLIIFSFFILLPSLRHTYVTAYNNSDGASRLLTDILEPHDKRIRPILNQSEPIKVYVTFNLVNLIEIDEVNQRISVNIWVNFSWWDELRTWNPDDYGGNDVIHPLPSDIWRPKMVITNSADERDVFKDIDSPLSIYSSGATRWYAGALYYYVCLMDLTYFPFDEQSCAMSLMSTNLGPEMEFIPVSPTLRTTEYVVNGEWLLKSSKVEPQKYPVSPDETLSFVMATVTFKRRPAFYLINLLIPTMCLSFLSLFGFVVPKESGERASFAITVLLSLTVYMGSVSGQLPANSDTFPLLSVYIFSLLCLSMFSVLIIVFQLRMTESSGSENGDTDDRNALTNEKAKSQNENDSMAIEPFHGEKGNTYSNMRNRVVPIGGSLDDKDREISTNNHDDIPDSHEDNAHLGSTWNRTPNMHSYTSALELIKNLVLKHDDMFLFTIFTILWTVFTIAFVSQMAG